MEDDVTAEMLLEELIRYLDGVKPGYGGIFRMLYDGYDSADIQKEYDLKKSTANYQIRRIRIDRNKNRQANIDLFLDYVIDGKRLEKDIQIRSHPTKLFQKLVFRSIIRK